MEEESSPVFDVEFNGNSEAWQTLLLQNKYVEKLKKLEWSIKFTQLIKKLDQKLF